MEKLFSVHLTFPGAMAQLYHIQCALSQGGLERAWLLPEFHCEIVDWRALAVQRAAWPTHMDETVCCEPNYMGFCNAFGIGAGCVWLDHTKSRSNLVWRHPWPPNIIADLVLSTNPEGKITNSNLKISTLVLHEATLLAAVPIARMVTPCSGSDNTPIVSWIIQEALIINQVVKELLCIRARHSRKN